MAWNSLELARYGSVKMEGQTRQGHKRYLQIPQSCTAPQNQDTLQYIMKITRSEVPAVHLNLVKVLAWNYKWWVKMEWWWVKWEGWWVKVEWWWVEVGRVVGEDGVVVGEVGRVVG